jgi:outer membrane scaffolding protein for murein synthesis (MipA/OmpV family)
LIKNLLGIACCLTSLVTYAQTDLGQPHYIEKSTLNASITLGYGGIENPVINADNITSPVLPSLAYYGEHWYFDDFSVGYSLLETPSYYLDLFGRFNDDGFFFELDGIDKLFAVSAVSSKSGGRPSIPSATPINLTAIERDLSYMVGLSSAVQLYDDVWLNTAFVQDVTDVHNGHEFFVNVYRNFEMLFGLASLEIGAVYKNSELIEYYYTVAAGESKTRLPHYNLTSAINYHVKASYSYPINESVSIDLKLKHTWLDSNLVHSQMVDKGGYFSGFAGVTYHF